MGNKLRIAETERDKAQPPHTRQQRNQNQMERGDGYKRESFILKIATLHWLQTGGFTRKLIWPLFFTHPFAFRKKKRLKEGSF